MAHPQSECVGKPLTSMNENHQLSTRSILPIAVDDYHYCISIIEKEIVAVFNSLMTLL
jgi:hypothetical protein